MATAHVQTKDAQTSSGTSLNVSLTGVVAGNHLSAYTAVGAPSGLTTAAGVAPTSTPTATWSAGNPVLANTNGALIMRSDYTENVAPGSWTVACKSNAAHEITGLVVEASGVATSLSKGQTSASATTLTTTTVQPGSITPTAGSVLITFVTDDGGATSADTIDSSFLVSSDATAWNGANQRAGVAHKDAVSAVATNPTWTGPGGGFHIMAQMIEFLAAAGAAAALPNKVIFIRQAVNRAATY